MPPQTDRATRPKLTSRGAATRSRIVLAAAELMHVQGVAATTIDDVLAASATSKSQFYQHFDDKSNWCTRSSPCAPTRCCRGSVCAWRRWTRFAGCTQWRDAMVQRCALRRGLWGCELGSLGSRIVRYRRQGEGIAVRALHRMADTARRRAGAHARQRSPSPTEADIRALATGLLAAVEGGYLLSQTGRDPRLMQAALNMAIGHVASFAAAAESML